MDSSPKMNKSIQRPFTVISIIFVLIHMVFLILAAITRCGHDFHAVLDCTGTVWISEDPYFELNVMDGYEIAYLEINGECVRVSFAVIGMSSRILIHDYEAPKAQGGVVSMDEDIYLDTKCK